MSHFFKKLFLLGVMFASLPAKTVVQVEETEKKSALEKLTGQVGQDANDAGRVAVAGLSDGTLKHMALTMENHGWGIIDRIRNDTDFPVDIFYNRTLHDLLPPGTTFRIKSLKRDYILESVARAEASALDDEEGSDEEGETSRFGGVEKGESKKNKRRFGREEKPDESEGGGFKAGVKKKKKSVADQPSNFRYLAARELAGNFRLKADTTDKDDPATMFTVSKHIKSNLNTYLGIESNVNPGAFLRVKKNNEAVFVKNTMLDFIVEDGQKSNDNFSSDFDKDSHWLLYSRGVKPEDPIDITRGTYLKSCSFKNESADAYLSVRGPKDAERLESYVKPKAYWFWAQGIRWGSDQIDYSQIGWEGGFWSSTDYTTGLYTVKNLEFRGVEIDRSSKIPIGSDRFEQSDAGDYSLLKTGVPGIINIFKGPYINMTFRALRSNSVIGQDFTPKEPSKSQPEQIRDNENHSRWTTMQNHNRNIRVGVGVELFTHIEQGLMIYNHLREMEYMNSVNKKIPIVTEVLPEKINNESMLNYWGYVVGDGKAEKSIRSQVLGKRTTVNYGDKIKLSCTGSYLTLFGTGGSYESLAGDEVNGLSAVFGSHDDTDSEYKKLKNAVSGATGEGVEPEDYAWFYVKGPHHNSDRWNCKIGSPVQDGDIVRFEHVATGKNLEVVRGKQPPNADLCFGAKSGRGDNSYFGSPEIVKVSRGNEVIVGKCKYDSATKPKDDEGLVGLLGSEGISSTDSNFVVKFFDPAGSNWCLGQLCSIVHQNTKQSLWSQHAYFGFSGGRFGLVTALLPKSSDDESHVLWFPFARESVAMPVQDVGWVGVPDGAAQTSAGDGEELEIEIVKLGLPGKLGRGETLTVNMPVHKKDPKVSGFAKDEVPNFSIANVVTLSPLLSKGVAWLEESLKTPGKAGIFFRAKCKDNGDIQVCLGTGMTLDYNYKIVIGGGNNTSTYILKKEFPGGVAVEKKMTEVYKADNPLAGAVPGQYIPYWVSIDNGLLVLGRGVNIGDNIILVWRDIDVRDFVNRVGFSSGDTEVSYAEVKITDSLQIRGPDGFYFHQDEPMYVSNEGVCQFDRVVDDRGNFVKEDLIFKVPGNGTAVLNVNGDSELYFFDRDKNKSFLIKSSEDGIKYRKDSIKLDLVTKIVKKIDIIRSALNLEWLFKAGIKAKREPDYLFDYFDRYPDHTLKKYLDGLDAFVKTEAPYTILRTLLEEEYDQEKHGGDFSEKAKSSLKDIAVEYIVQKFADDFENKAYLALMKEELLSAVLGEVKVRDGGSGSEGVDPKSWINEEVVQSIAEASMTVNDHYRVKFQSFKTINEIRKSLVQKVSDSLYPYFKKIVETLESYTPTAIIEALVKNNGYLEGELARRDIKSMDLQDIESRIKSVGELLKEKDTSKEMFEKVFPDQLINYYIQRNPEFEFACVSFEKYSQVDSDYKLLASSKDQDSDRLDVSEGGGKPFWVSFNKGQFLIGEGSGVGGNLLLYHNDINNPFTDVQKIGFSSAGKSAIAKVKLGNTVKITQRELEASQGRAQLQQVFDYSGALQVIAPYEYHLSQNQQQVQFKDAISKRTIFPGKTPQQGTLYNFTLSLKPNGFPDLVWTTEPENKIKLELEKRAMIAQAKSDALLQASTMVQGQGLAGGVIGAAASITFAGLSVTEATDAAKLRGASGVFRDRDAYVYTDSMGKMPILAESMIPPEVEQNKYIVSQQLDLGSKWTASDLEKLQRLVPLYNRVLDSITHPYTIKGMKEQLFTGIKSIYNAQKMIFKGATQIDMVQLNILESLLKAYNNPYLVDTNIDQEVKTKQTWYGYINALSRQILELGNNISLPACYGEYIWLPDVFRFKNKGSVTFKVKANNDVFVCFAENSMNVRNSDKDIYEVVLGAWNNEKTVIRAKSLDKAVAETKNDDALVNPIDVKQFWVSFNNGRIIIGTGELSPENAVGVYDPETRETTKPEWGAYSYSVKMHPEWLRLAIGDEKGFKGKDLLMEELLSSKDDKEKLELAGQIKQRQSEMGSLFKKNIYAYQTQDGAQGSYSQDPFMWQDPYFNAKNSKIQRVGLSSWDSEVEFSDIDVSVCVEEVGLYFKNLMAQVRNNKNQPIFGDDPLVEDYRKKVKMAIYGDAGSSSVKEKQEVDDLVGVEENQTTGLVSASEREVSSVDEVPEESSEVGRAEADLINRGIADSGKDRVDEVRSQGPVKDNPVVRDEDAPVKDVSSVPQELADKKPEDKKGNLQNRYDQRGDFDSVKNDRKKGKPVATAKPSKTSGSNRRMKVGTFSYDSDSEDLGSFAL